MRACAAAPRLLLALSRGHYHAAVGEDPRVARSRDAVCAKRLPLLPDGARRQREGTSSDRPEHPDVGIEHRVAPLFGNVGDLLLAKLDPATWTRFTSVVAFARMSGVAHLEPHLTAFTAAGRRADVTVGTDLRSTSYEAAWYLMHAVAANGRLLLATSEPGATFHP